MDLYQTLTDMWPSLWPTLAAIGVILAFVPVLGLYMTFIERKIAAYVQDRVGPNRVGPFGLFQAIADGIKIFLKEQIIPDHVYTFLYFVAPTISLMTAMFALVVMPFGPVPVDYKEGFRFVVAPGIDTGIIFMFAISSLSAYGIILGGWASNNKYSLYGAIRSCAQFISYEIPLGLSIIGVIAISGSLNLEKIVATQGGSIWDWNVFWQPLAFIVFFTSALAETNRLPFDLPECEQELVGGFHTEYGGIKFVLFFLAEYTHIVTVSFLTALLFLGGWHFPGLTGPVDASLGGMLLRTFVLVAKVGGVVAFIMLLRWALPRFRFDQLMGLAWKGLIPLGLINLVLVAIVLTLELPKHLLAGTALLLFVAAVFSSYQLQRSMNQNANARRLNQGVQGVSA
ncbi:NADH-quinone oxidoreductase subunit H [Pirellula sp. SH-Sr6A]|uniref:NADH-quinone oxidoreductase subunit NuoH n=1 Tax=Pirellula sp. SH-Sr6A TaxID=1632865 RepID=UPI00078C97BD|nr:NADH-quinone oxidoreductase subunit NuoH [Pirellula sp. SH-Sr6A]AMV32015.1 NADH-quinone oxidoreductase subunit H [Pirellula sp. SH-Sr6A]